MTIQEATASTTANLSNIYEHREAGNITDLVMEKITGLTKTDRIIHKTSPLSPEQMLSLQKYTDELLAHKPVQYVLEEAWFCGMKFFVNDQVLIPRPETEELVEWVVTSMDRKKIKTAGQTFPVILDVGTGSGCIAIALKKKLPTATIFACDISPGALAVAQRNATMQQAAITFVQLDFLDPADLERLPVFDCLVSNPPYVPFSEQRSMAAHVTAYEPHLALFVPDADPLVFYRALAMAASKQTNRETRVFAEIHEALSVPVRELFVKGGFRDVESRKDIHGRERMISAVI